MKRKGFVGGLVVVLFLGERVEAKAVRKARGYWEWISRLLVGAPRALGVSEERVRWGLVVGWMGWYFCSWGDYFSILALTRYMLLRLRVGITLLVCSGRSLSLLSSVVSGVGCLCLAGSGRRSY